MDTTEHRCTSQCLPLLYIMLAHTLYICAYIYIVTFSQSHDLVRSKITMEPDLEGAEPIFAIGPSCPEKAFSSVTSICPNLLCTSENPLLQ